MALPITGPYQRIENHRSLFTNYGFYHPDGITISRKWYRQAKPFTKPLPWTYEYRQIQSWSTNEPGFWAAGHSSANFDLSVNPDAYNEAYARFKERMGVAASLSVTLAEQKQARDMLSKRCVQLATFVTQLRKLDFKSAAQTLGVTAPPLQVRKRKKGRLQPFEYAVWRDDGSGSVDKRARKFYLKKGPRAPSKVEPRERGLIREDSHKAFANNYLEFHFGWSPLLADIGNAVEVMQNRTPPFKVKGKARTTTRRTTQIEPDAKETWRHEIECAVRIEARVEVSNPNLYLANQMGFVNPATVAWELVPYSFVIDWFVNVSDVLGSATDYMGLTLMDPFYTTLSRDRVTYRYEKIYGSSAVGSVVKTGTFLGVRVQRTIGPPPGPTLKMRPAWDMSWRRGLAAISLLIQKMR